MATTLEILRFLAPEFASVSDADASTALELAALNIDVLQYGDKAQQAVSYYAAHILKVRKDSQGDASSSVGSQYGSVREGDLAVTRDRGARDGTSIDALSSTIYGQQFLALRHGCILPAIGWSVVRDVPYDSGGDS